MGYKSAPKSGRQQGQKSAAISKGTATPYSWSRWQESAQLDQIRRAYSTGLNVYKAQNNPFKALQVNYMYKA